MQSVTENGGSASDANRQSDVPDGELLKQAITVDTEKVRGHLDEVVRSTVEATLNQLLDEEADRIAGAGKYERSPERKDFRSGSYQRKLRTKAGEVELTVPRLRKLPLETAIIGRSRPEAGPVRCLRAPEWRGPTTQPTPPYRRGTVQLPFSLPRFVLRQALRRARRRAFSFRAPDRRGGSPLSTSGLPWMVTVLPGRYPLNPCSQSIVAPALMLPRMPSDTMSAGELAAPKAS